MSELPGAKFARGGGGGRGRGRGRGRISEPSPSGPTNSNDPTGNFTSTRPSSLNPSDGPVTSVPSKFKPRMVKRVEKVEAIDLDCHDQSSSRGGRGRGRGRGAERGGRGRGAEIVMTASGAFAMGPAEGGPRIGRMSQGPTRSGMRKIDNSVTSAGGSSRGQSGSVTPWDGGPSESFDLYSDIDENPEDEPDGEEGEGDRGKVADLNDISTEHPMAPLTLPWDPNRIAERERLMVERDGRLRKLAELKLKVEDEKPVMEGLGADLKPQASRSTHSPALISGSVTPAFTRASTLTATESVVKSETVEEQTLEAMKTDVKLKLEQMEEMATVAAQIRQTSDRNPTSSSSKSGPPLYIFQFPRHFPQFRKATDIAFNPPTDLTADPIPTVLARKKILKKKKPQVDDWAGWGKGGRRDDCPGVPVGEEDKTVEGQIGELVIRRSGRVQMLIGDVAYDVLPAAQPTFHQEVAVIDPKPESSLRAMFVLGPTNKKFIVAPDVSSLLERDERERKAKSEKSPTNVS
ncbi:RNA polymerase III RPC4-domain-containing protein [Melampsora americana]|nr:RNA polymerase III RPC4-domain-containing protein [Melampsora americana]